MNFNIDEHHSISGEWDLFKSTTSELINLYGVQILYIESTLLDSDDILGDHRNKYLETNGVKFYVLPNDKESWGDEGLMFTKFGLQNSESMNYFISEENMKIINPQAYEFDSIGGELNIIGDILMLPDGKLLEITNVQKPKGENNLLGYHSRNRNEVNVYEIVAVEYIHNKDDIDITNEELNYKEEVVYNAEFANLDAIFNQEDTEKIKQDSATSRRKIDEENPFGDYG